MKATLAIISGLIAVGAAIPYIIDILSGKVRPARSTRLMYVVLMVVALLQQNDLGSGWSLCLIAGEALLSITILGFSFKYGMGGLSRLDIACYALLAIDVIVWVTTQKPLLAVHLTILADTIATVPVLVKTYKDPTSETPLFFFLGALCGFLAVFSETSFAYHLIAFPLYLGIINFSVALLAVRKKEIPVTSTDCYK